MPPAKKTTKVTLDKAYMFAGRTYGPGEADVPEGFPDSKALAERTKISSARNTVKELFVSTGAKSASESSPADDE